jgi:hypothetical protein
MAPFTRSSGFLLTMLVLSVSLSTAATATPKKSRTSRTSKATATLPSRGIVKPAASMDLAGLDPALYQKACLAYDKARKAGRATRSRLVVIDYSRPSTEERLWVFDLERQTLLFKELVAHGKNTGDNTARSFSNVPGSLQTSVGVFVTDDVYRGKHGKSLRLDGLEQGFNDKARERAIVIHGADYVDDRSASKQGRLGRSWGCPALPTAVAPTIIDAIAGGAVVFAWGDDKAWQARSTFLQHGA